MQRYIEQLVDDIHRATWRVRAPHEIWDEVDINSDLELEDMSYAEKYIYGRKEKITHITGIPVESLPPENKLNKSQKCILVEELDKLLKIFHFHLDFPEKFPKHLRYSFIYKFWNESHVAVSFGESHIEFCDFEEETCPFPGYCDTCREVASQMSDDKDSEEERSSPSDSFDIEDMMPF
jgi:hypothetical protein